MTSAGFDAEAGMRVCFKCENLQRGGAFKIRGAANLVLSLSKEALANGVVAYSSGNHAQATAIAAKYVGVPATIVMPEDAPKSKMLVTDDEIRAAVKFLLLRLKILAEPSGAVPVAAVLFHKLPKDIRSIGVVISGGNIDFEDLAKY
jgi:threonine dehydratase